MNTRGRAEVETPRLDARPIAAADRRASILSAFKALPVGESMEVLDDQELNPLFYLLRSEAPAGFGWHCVEAGPKVWRVRISRLATWWADGHMLGTSRRA